MVKKAPRQPCPLNQSAIKARASELGMTHVQLARAVGVEPRTFQYWLSGRSQPDIDQVTRLAEALRVGLEDITIELPDAVRIFAADATTDLDDRSQDLRGIAIKGRVVTEFSTQWEKFSAYWKHVGLSPWPLRGCVRRFAHDGEDYHYYAEVRITPTRKLAPGESATFVFTFSFNLGTIVRIDFGRVTIRSDGTALMQVSFGHEREEVEVDPATGAVTAWLWFGPEKCDFLVRSPDVDFELDLDAKSVGRDPLHRDRSKILCFRAAPHHIEAARASGVRLSDWEPR